MKKITQLLILIVWVFILGNPVHWTENKLITTEKLKTNIEALNNELSWGTISLYARSRGYTPFFYLEDFSRYYGHKNSGKIILDDWSQMDPLEFVALTGTVMKVEKILSYSGLTLLQVKSSEYPYDSDPHYIDARFMTVIKSKTPLRERNITLPKKESIIQSLKKQVWSPYIWWGNVGNGIPDMIKYYAPNSEFDDLTKSKLTMSGFDCSGLLYWSTNGYTPRNTSKLITFWTGLLIEWKTIEEIIWLVKPLDIIVWNGHNRIILDKDSIIESTVNFTSSGNYSQINGVRIVPLADSLKDIIEEKKRKGVNDWNESQLPKKEKFVIRRWYP
jgi:hypothetical protein